MDRQGKQSVSLDQQKRGSFFWGKPIFPEKQDFCLSLLNKARVFSIGKHGVFLLSLWSSLTKRAKPDHSLQNLQIKKTTNYFHCCLFIFLLSHSLHLVELHEAQHLLKWFNLPLMIQSQSYFMRAFGSSWDLLRNPNHMHRYMFLFWEALGKQ